MVVMKLIVRVFTQASSLGGERASYGMVAVRKENSKARHQ
jgi:hypothetical protein